MDSRDPLDRTFERHSLKKCVFYHLYRVSVLYYIDNIEISNRN